MTTEKKMGGESSPKWVKVVVLLAVWLVAAWLWVIPGLAAIVTRHFEGQPEFRKGSPDLILSDSAAVITGFKFVGGGLIVILVAFLIYRWVSDDE